MRIYLSDDLQKLKLEFDNDIEFQQVSSLFTRKIRNWKFRTKGKRWKGDVPFMKSGIVSVGFWKEIKILCEKYQFPFQFYGHNLLIENVSKEEFTRFCLFIMEGHKKTPRPEQINAAYMAVRYKYGMLDLSTNSGKTLIQYLIYSWLIYNKKIKKMLVICPDADLVIQNHAEYVDYCQGKYNLRATMVHGGSSVKDISENRLITANYQTLNNRGPEFFDGVDALIFDEGHKATAESYGEIIKKCYPSKYRILMTGSIVDDKTAEHYTLIERSGPVLAIVSKKDTIDAGYSSDIIGKFVVLDWVPIDVRKELAQAKSMPDPDYESMLRFEQNYIRSSEERLMFMANFILSRSGNCLVYFNDKKYGYGRRLFEKLKELSRKVGKEIYYMDGDTDKKSRSLYMERLNDGTNKVLVASYGTFSTGKSVNNIKHIVCAEASKDEITINQGTGRGMRIKTHEGLDNTCIWWDFVDDFSIHDDMYEYTGYMMKWMNTKIRYFNEWELKYDVTKAGISTSDLLS